MTRLELTIALAVRDAGARREYARALKTMDGTRLIREAAEADILVLEVREGEQDDIKRLKRASSVRDSGEIFLTCADPNARFLIEAMRYGVDEVLTLPLDRKELSRAISRYRARQAENGIDGPVTAPATGRVIGVLGVRPGVGATTLAVNLAAELQRESPAALVDLGVPLSEAPLFLDMEYEYTWGDVAQNLARLDATYLGSVMPRHSSGLSLLASPGEEGLDLEVPDAMEPILNEMRRSFSHIVVDTDGVLSPFGLRELDRADEVIVVLNLTLPCLAHAQRLLDTLRRLETTGSRIRLAANRQIRNEGILPSEAEVVLQRRINWVIPEDGPAALSAVNQGLPLSQADPKSAAARAIHEIAAELCPGVGRRGIRNLGKLGGLSSFFRRRNKGTHEMAAMEAI